jgi:hypothetical protein
MAKVELATVAIGLSTLDVDLRPGSAIRFRLLAAHSEVASFGHNLNCSCDLRIVLRYEDAISDDATISGSNYVESELDIKEISLLIDDRGC